MKGQAPAGVTLWVTVDDIQATFDHLAGIGARVSKPPARKPWGTLLAGVFDPDGNLVGLAQREPEKTPQMPASACNAL